MSQCVPSWDLDDNSFPFHVPSYEVAELTWQNGQLALHGLASKPPQAPTPPHVGAGTLESIVNQTAFQFVPKSAAVNGLAPWFDHREQRRTAAVATDALVPVGEHAVLPEGGGGGVESTRVGSCSGATVPGSRSINGASKATCGRRRVRDGRELTATETTASFDTFGAELGGVGCTSASMWSQENTSSGKEYARTTSGEDRDSVSHSTPQIQTIDDEEVRRGKKFGKSSVSTKRSRAAAVHSQSERKRRDRINQRMKTLQKMVPNSSKTDKASMLDEVIDYIKQLQTQLHMIKLCMSQVMMMQQYLHMTAMHGMGVIGLNAVGRTMGMPPIVPPTATVMPPIIPPAAFMPMAPWNVQGDRMSSPDVLSTLLSNPMGIDAYSRLAAMYQQYPQPLGPKK